jgi:micrococcal nuclease
MQQVVMSVLCTLVFSSASAFSQLAIANPTITRFYDGDTVKIDDGQRQYKLRITDIDAPERNQRYGKQARRTLMQLCKDAEITLTLTGIDKYQRDLGYLSCNTIPVSEYMVEQGYAWFNTRYSNNWALQVLENEARNAKRGLWKQKKPMPPWVWRQKHAHN